MKRFLTLATLAVCLLSVLFLEAPANASAHALKPQSSAPWGSYPYEGGPPCVNVPFNQVRNAGNVDWGGTLLNVTLWYSSLCGAVADVYNVNGGGVFGCQLYIDRSDDGGATWVNHVQDLPTGGNGGNGQSPVANDLHGRLARGALVCNGLVLLRTAWY